MPAPDRVKGHGMRADLKAACRPLGVVQRFVLREHLWQLESMLGPAETVRIMASGWWRGHRALIAVTSGRLLLVRGTPQYAATADATVALGSISHLSVHASPPCGARFRVGVGLDLEEFSVARHSGPVERALRESLR